jgi:hypothetical protein
VCARGHSAVPRGGFLLAACCLRASGTCFASSVVEFGLCALSAASGQARTTTLHCRLGQSAEGHARAPAQPAATWPLGLRVFLKRASSTRARAGRSRGASPLIPAPTSAPMGICIGCGERKAAPHKKLSLSLTSRSAARSLPKQELRSPTATHPRAERHTAR